jgi:hypothetical protein
MTREPYGECPMTLHGFPVRTGNFAEMPLNVGAHVIIHVISSSDFCVNHLHLMCAEPLIRH